MKTTRSLSFFVTVWMAAAIAVSMAAYAVYERTTMPGLSLRELAVQHLGHVLGLGAMIYVLCWGVFYFVLLRPLNRIYLHLYTIGAGRLTTLELGSNVREIRTIVDGVNLMLSRLKQSADNNAMELAQARVAEIRDLARQLTTPDHEHVTTLLDKLADLERTLPGILAGQGALSAAHAEVSSMARGQSEDSGDVPPCCRAAGHAHPKEKGIS